MDNVCHTLVGAALARSGLRHRTRLATATLLIGANLPDIDVVAIAFGQALAFRRGWTHGILALAVLPVLLTLGMVAWGRWRERTRPDPIPLVPGQILWLATIAVVSHPFLDWLNTYGVRLLMPFNDRWFYGDAVFIIDPWLWLVLGGAVAWSLVRQRRGHPAPGRPAALGLTLAGLYIVGMIGLTRYGRQIVVRDLDLPRDPGKRVLQVAPTFPNPVYRDVVLAAADRYWFGHLEWRPRPRLDLTDGSLDPWLGNPLAKHLDGDPRAEQLRTWARFPFYIVEGVAGTTDRVIRIDDARYSTGRRSWASAQAIIEGPGRPDSSAVP